MARARGRVATGAGAKAPGRSMLWVQGLACGLLLAMAAPLALVLGVALAPSLLWAAFAPASAQGTGRVMLVYAVAALAPFTTTLWDVAQSWPAAQMLLEGMRVPALAWAAQGGGWLLGQVAPLVARMVLDARVGVRAARLREARERLRAEWGMDDGPVGEEPGG